MSTQDSYEPAAEPTLRFFMSEKFGEIAKALAEVQGQIKPIITNKEVTVKSERANYKYKYADLGAIAEKVLPLTSKAKIAVTQIPFYTRGQVTVNTFLLHPSEQYLRVELTLPVSGDGAQKIGSAISYAKRYSLGALVMQTSDAEDDDAQKADGKGNGGQRGQAQNSIDRDEWLDLKSTTRKNLHQAKTQEELGQIASWIKGQHKALSNDREIRELYKKREVALKQDAAAEESQEVACEVCHATPHEPGCPEGPTTMDPPPAEEKPADAEG